ncbi:MAG: hypothetical protein ACE5I1_00110 [bacterium]
MWSNTIFSKRSILLALCTILFLMSCASSKIAQYQVANKAESGLSILEMSPPTYETVEQATLRHRSYLPSEKHNTWIESIDGEPIAKFIGEGKDPKQVKSYQLSAGKHQIALMYEGGGLSDRYIPMFEDSLRVTYAYTSKLRKPVVLEVETSAGTNYTIKAHAKVKECNISLMKNEVVVAENIGKMRYWYSNVLHRDNRYLNERYFTK